MPPRVKKLTDPSEVSAAIAAGQEQGRFLLEVISADFDPADLMAEYEEIVRAYALRHTPRADGSTLRSISLTHRPGATEPLYDGNNTQYDPATNQKLFRESDFTEFNEALNGNVYVFDTTLPHTALNASREDRVHITMALADEEK